MLLLSGPNMAGNEWKYVKDCLDTGWVSSVGAYVYQFEKMSSEFAGTNYAVSTRRGQKSLQLFFLNIGCDFLWILFCLTFAILRFHSLTIFCIRWNIRP